MTLGTTNAAGCIFPASGIPSDPPQGIESSRATSRYWAPRDLPQGSGDFECPFPTCGRRFDSKQSLSNHVTRKHRSGTYRDRPRSFELEAGYTQHVPLRAAGASPLLVAFAPPTSQAKTVFACI